MDLSRAVNTAELYLYFAEIFKACTAAEIKEIKHKKWTNKISRTLKIVLM